MKKKDTIDTPDYMVSIGAKHRSLLVTVYCSHDYDHMISFDKVTLQRMLKMLDTPKEKAVEAKLNASHYWR